MFSSVLSSLGGGGLESAHTEYYAKIDALDISGAIT